MVLKRAKQCSSERVELELTARSQAAFQQAHMIDTEEDNPFESSVFADPTTYSGSTGETVHEAIDRVIDCHPVKKADDEKVMGVQPVAVVIAPGKLDTIQHDEEMPPGRLGVLRFVLFFYLIGLQAKFPYALPAAVVSAVVLMRVAG